MTIELYEHNQQAYKAALLMLEEEGKATVIHPTGTGKSFIGFKFVDEHPDWRICWLSPSDYIYRMQIENIQKMDPDIILENLTFLTYAKLMNMDLDEVEELNPTLIIMDEFHRAGASEWGKGVSKLFSAYPEAMLLGLSATNIRYLDNQRDMTEELFDGNIASQMTLGEAIVRGILKAPKYVISLYSYEQDLSYYEDRINNSRNRKVKDEAERYLEALKRALEKADGLQEIFTRHIKNKNSRFIVFCSNYEHMQEMYVKSKEWFSYIDHDAHFYKAYSNDPETSQAFQNFKNDQSEHLKLLFCIDMLNEGVHVDDLDGVILFRPTISPIIYKQQIGRAMSASSKKQPIIFDIVNNFGGINSIDSVREEMQEAVNYYSMMDKKEEIETDYFEIIDEVQDCMQIFEKMNETLSASWDLMYILAKEFYLENGHLDVPKKYKTRDGYSLGAWICTQRKIYKNQTSGKLSNEQIEMLNDIEMIWDNKNDLIWNRYFEALKSYHKDFKHVDVPIDYITEDGLMLGKWISRIRGYKSEQITGSVLTDERIRALDDLGMIWDAHSYRWQRNYEAASLYYKQNGNLDFPEGYKSEDGVRLDIWIANMKSAYMKSNGISLTEERKAKLEAIGVVFASKYDLDWDKAYHQAELYYEAFGHLDVPYDYQTEDGFHLGAWISKHRITKNGNSAIQVSEKRKNLLNKIGMIWKTDDSEEKYLNAAKDYYLEYGHLDVYGDFKYHDVWLGTWLSRKRNEYAKGSIDQKLYKELSSISMDWRTSKEKSWDMKYQLAKSFYEENGHLKVPTCEIELSNWLIKQRQAYKNKKLNNHQIHLLEEIGMNWVCENSWEAYYELAKVYYFENKHLDIPENYVTSSGHKLGQWLARQKTTPLSEEKKELLSLIGMDFTCDSDKQWLEGYQHASNYFKTEQNLLVHGRYECDDGFKLGIWISSQRSKYKNNQLTANQIQLLEEIQMVFDPLEMKWNQNYAQAEIYKNKHGNLKIPVTFKTKDGFRLGAWLNAQKKAYQKQKGYSEDHFMKLTKLGMEW